MHGKNPKISVVVPTYNEEKFLPKLLESLQNQEFNFPYEVIIVDNNSTDKTSEIAKKYGARIVKETKQGYANACNAGFYNAKADIIARADADYIVPKDWLKKIWVSFQEDKNLTAVGGPIYPLESYWWENYISYPAVVIWMHLLKFLGRGFLFPNIAMKKKAFYETGGFNTVINFGEDMDMCMKLKDIGKVSLDLNVYVHSSIRRAKDLGMFKFIVGYSFANQIALWRGAKVKYGLHPVRVIPNRPINPKEPWLYLIVTPLSIVAIVGVIFLASYHPIQQYIQTQIIPTISQQFSK